MLMKSLNKNTKQRASGFSLIEMMIVMAIVIIMASITFVSLIPVLRQERLNNAYNTVLSAMRIARDNAISQRTSYSVTFSSSVTPNTITIAPTITFAGSQPAIVYQLPTDVTFLAQSGLPATAPDGYGTGLVAIDLGYTASGTGTGGSSSTYFCPDGSAQADATGNCSGSWDGGVIYISRSGDLLSSRAVTLWGGTGRIRGWRLYTKTGGYQWLRQ